MTDDHWFIPREKIELFSKGLAELNQMSIFGEINYPYDQASDSYKNIYEDLAVKVIGVINDKDCTNEVK